MSENERLMDVGYYENPIPKGQPDPNLRARFYQHKVKRFKYSEDGKREFSHWDNETWVEIRPKGMPKSSVSHKKEDKHEKMFPVEWQAYKEHNGEGIHGTPLSHLPFLGPADIDNLRVMGILTVEDLADLQESAIPNLRNGREMKANAQAWIDFINKAKSEAAPKRVEIKESKDKTEVSIKKKKGRPKK